LCSFSGAFQGDNRIISGLFQGSDRGISGVICYAANKPDEGHPVLSQERNAMTPPSPDLSILEGFLTGCGLRRAELEQVRCRDISEDEQGRYVIHVAAIQEYPNETFPCSMTLVGP
jgi:hypothetical protein